MRRLALLLAALLLISPGPALAHKVIASVFASGDVIEGEIGFSNGDMAPDALVEVFDDAGNKLGETRTDADGFFTYKPTKRVPLVFRSNLGAGHVAEVKMGLDELPEIEGAAQANATAPPPAVGSAPVDDKAVVAGAVSGLDLAAFQDEQRRMIVKAVQQQVIPLRRDIEAYKEKANLQGVLGGIGYIFGLFGVGYYVAARRKLAKAE